MQDAATIITAVGTAFAAIITAILGGSRWLLKVWFSYQLKVKQKERENQNALMADMKSALDLHSQVLAQHKFVLEGHSQKMVEFDQKLTAHQDRLESSIVGYKNNQENFVKVVDAVKTYVQKTEEWKKGIESQLVQMKAGNVFIRTKK